jgi:hypothetical protein
MKKIQINAFENEQNWIAKNFWEMTRYYWYNRMVLGKKRGFVQIYVDVNYSPLRWQDNEGNTHEGSIFPVVKKDELPKWVDGLTRMEFIEDKNLKKSKFIPYNIQSWEGDQEAFIEILWCSNTTKYQIMLMYYEGSFDESKEIKWVDMNVK